MAYDTDLLLNKISCAQCGRPIEWPLWSERERNRVSYLWSCMACDYQFVTVAILKSETAEGLVPERSTRHQQPPIAA